MTALDSKLVYTSDLTTWKFSYFLIIVWVIIFFLLFLQITCISFECIKSGLSFYHYLLCAKKPPKFFERFRMIIDLNYHKGLDDRHLLRLTGQN